MRLLRYLGLALILLAATVAASAQTTQFNGLVRDTTNTPIASGNVAFILKPGVDTTISGNARFTPTTVNCPIIVETPTSIIGNGTTTTLFFAGGGITWQIGDQIIITGTGTLLDVGVSSAWTLNGASGGNTFTFGSGYNASLFATGYIGGIYASGGTGKCVVVQNSAINPAYTSYSVAIQPAGITTSSFNTYAIGAGPVDISTIVPTPTQQPSYSFVDLFSNGQTISGLKNFTNTGNTYSGGTFTNPILNNATFNTTTATSWTIATPTIQQPTFTTQPITLQDTNNYSLSWTNPSAARSISITDPGGTDVFAWVGAAQTLTNKTMGTGWLIGKPPASVNGTNTVGDYGVPAVVAKVDLLAQSTSLGPTTLFTYTTVSSQSMTEVDYQMSVSTATGAGTVGLVISWTDCSGISTNQGLYTMTASPAGNLIFNSGVQSMQGRLSLCVQSGSSVGYTTTDSTPGTGKYDLHLRVSLE